MSVYLDTINNGTFDKPLYKGNLDACFQQGQAAGDQGVSRDSNPYIPHTAEYHWWRSGWLNSLDELTGE